MTEATAASNVTTIFDQICAERGGPAELSIAEQALARALAMALTTDPIDARAVITLLEHLPPVAPKVKQLNLHRLTDQELQTLERLVSIATGEGEPKLEPAPRHDHST